MVYRCGTFFVIFSHMKKQLFLALSFIFCLTFFLPPSQVGVKAQKTIQQAQNYFEQGEYEKALSTFKRAYKKEPTNTNILIGIIKTHQQLEGYDAVEKLIKGKLSGRRDRGTLLVEMGYNYQLQEKDSLSNLFYGKAIQLVEENTNNAYRVGRAFQEHSLLREAVSAYETGMRLNPKANYNVQLARIYGELGDVEKMFNSYLALIQKSTGYVRSAQRNFGQYITDDPENEANIIFKKLLLKKLQTEQNILYNDFLSWLFIQQKEYKKAFIQEKAIYKRSEGNIQGIVALAGIAVEEKSGAVAEEILRYIIENAIDDATKLDAERTLLLLEVQKLNSPEEKTAIRNRYETILNVYERWDYAVPVKVDYAHFLAFHNEQAPVAISYLKKQIKLEKSRFPQARLKMELADILVLEEKFNQALIYYSQVQKDIKNNVISQEARFKVAKTSYYKGDFPWAEAQLNVLKAGATQLIANDALELLLVIRDNSQEDSLQIALKKYAKADLFTYQNKPDAAISLYGEILETHKGESIEDETLLAQAALLEAKSAFAKARKNYETIIEYFGDGTLADNAHYKLAELYAGPLNEPEKAKQHYERIIFDFQDSIFYVEAQKKYRQLRGDAIN
jgi:tetratricopeptide (TPR) repeat protein